MTIFSIRARLAALALVAIVASAAGQAPQPGQTSELTFTDYPASSNWTARSAASRRIRS